MSTLNIIRDKKPFNDAYNDEVIIGGDDKNTALTSIEKNSVPSLYL